ncbi:MAG: CPC_1213 family protein [Bacillota bacterium]
MGKSNKMKSTSNGKKEDGTFRSKKVKHNPQAESARAVFGVDERNNPIKD